MGRAGLAAEKYSINWLCCPN